MQVFFWRMGMLLQICSVSIAQCLKKAKKNAYNFVIYQKEVSVFWQNFGVIKWQTWSLGSVTECHRQNSSWVLTITSRATSTEQCLPLA
jgi:hypothetical protein